MRINTATAILAVLALATAAIIVAEDYPVGCALRTPFTGKPTGATAVNRLKGYLEAMEVIQHSALADDTKQAALGVLLGSERVDKYLVEVSTP